MAKPINLLPNLLPALAATRYKLSMSTPPKKDERSSFLSRNLLHIKRQAVVSVSRAWQEIAGTARSIRGVINDDLPRSDTERVLAQMQAVLNARGGEVSARANAVALGSTYLGLSEKGRTRFLQLLATHFAASRALVQSRMEALEKASNDLELTRAENDLRDALEAPRLKILRQFNSLPEGVKFLVDLRGDLIALKEQHHELAGLEMDVRRLLATWFDIGLLDLREITWQSPAALLEKLIAYEAVHEIRSWNDLKNRLDSDRRCYAFFHHKMPGEPLIFVEIALVNSIADNVQTLLDESAAATNPEKADTAIFYSISNAQMGLSGISFGNFLIKRVVEKISKDLSNIKTFATLSPIPGFRKWLDQKMQDRSIVSAQDANTLMLLSDHDWHKDNAKQEELKSVLLRLCAYYLAVEKRKVTAFDSVAHFHLTNGAVMERINWLGDTSPKGLRQSAGMMVNYLYKLDDIETNHETYTSGKPFAISRQVRQLAKL